ncbi:hypothetical protein [Hymenobacter sp. B81]|uniref:hypothetical protein n=1 Tax=Hymenobacter sp. B81 TaxID=3344878 RepID=UPI0037DCCB4D
MLNDLEGDAFLLAYTMSNLSELGWSAGWMQNLEYVLWHAVTTGRREFGRVTIGSNDIRALKLLSERCGCWIYYEEEQGETAIPLAEWQRKFAQAVEQDSRLLR